MNKTILMGRLTKDPEVRYSQSTNPVAIARYTLAVDRRFKREGEPSADFIPCVAFGKGGEFVEKFFKKGQLVSVVGRIQVRSWDDKDGNKRYTTEIITEEHYFAESKKQSTENNSDKSSAHYNKENSSANENIEDEDLPFN